MKQVGLQTFIQDRDRLPRSTTILQETGLRALLLHLKVGESIPEHQARGAITVQCLDGEVTFSAGSERVSLRPGLLISLEPGSPHKLEAQQDALLLVTLAEQET